jgi:Uncharacterized oxidoreductases, Fe-dependent alcohol dehydrogenase family
MQAFTQYTPTEVVFGADTENEVGKLIRARQCSKVLLVYGGGSVVKSGLLKRVQTALAKEDIAYQELGGVVPNPRLSLAEEGVQKALEFSADFILAVGGGSAIDTAKGIAHGAANPQKKLWDIWTGKEQLDKSLPVGCILTISAAGSEMSQSAVLSNQEIGKKAGINTPFNRPAFAIMNPELTYTLPKYQIACGIVDIMMHTLERYFIPNTKNQMTDEIAEGLLRTVIANGEIAYAEATNYDAMSELMWCGSLSHNGITGLGRPMDFCVHKFGHALGARFDEAHGATLSVMWGAWANYVYKEDLKRFAHYARSVWGIQIEEDEAAARAAIDCTIQYFKEIGMPTNLTELLGEAQEDSVLYELAMNATLDNTVKLSALRTSDVAGVYEIFKIANKEQIK